MKKLLILIHALVIATLTATSQTTVPKILSHIRPDEQGKLCILMEDSTKLTLVGGGPGYTLSQLRGNPKGTQKGISLNFNRKDLYGRIIYGLINYKDAIHPIPVYRSMAALISKGKAELDFDLLRGRFDMSGWEKTGYGTIGYRVVTNRGAIIYDGIVSFSGTGPFEVINTILTGPFVNLVTDHSATISFETSQRSICSVKVGEKEFVDPEPVFRHEIELTGLQPGKEYTYVVKYGMEQSYAFNTAPEPGSRKPFLFSYSSDSRGGNGWGERNLYGPNAYILKKIMAVGAQQKVAFAQFTGDLISGYGTDPDNLLLQYHNWLITVTPFGHQFPIIIGMGNHEALSSTFSDPQRKFRISVDKFPYADESAEALFARVAVNPHNGPASEDGSLYDPDLKTTDFPPYDETVFYYTYDNVAMVVLNSNYLYTTNANYAAVIGGNIHAYVMDNQMKWLKKTLSHMEKDDNIDHVFVTIHTPFFPNGGHVYDDMWYDGHNEPRPNIAGKNAEKGIIERRDQLLDMIVNKSPKVAALLTGDEHNYCKTKIGPETPIYPKGYKEKKLKLKRTIYQINNGAAGAPYYAQQQTPWSAFTSGFTTQNAVCMFRVEGKKVSMVVINPDTLEEVDSLELR